MFFALAISLAYVFNKISIEQGIFMLVIWLIFKLGVVYISMEHLPIEHRHLEIDYEDNVWKVTMDNHRAYIGEKMARKMRNFIDSTLTNPTSDSDIEF
jgi:hypothetical protein